MSGEARRVRDCPYRLGPGYLRTREGYARYRCILQCLPCNLRGELRLSACSRYRRYMSRAVPVPERREPYVWTGGAME